MFLFKKVKNGIDYYYLRENKSINGRSVCVFQKYIGNKEQLVKAIKRGILDDAFNIKPDKTIVYHFGAVATLIKLCKKNNLFDLIDKTLGKRDQNNQISYYLIIAAINRIIRAKSKRAILGWVQDTSIPNILAELECDKLTSQNYWNNMDLIGEEKIGAIETEIVKEVSRNYRLKFDLIASDNTNFYSYIHTFNDRCKIERRGNNKQKRMDLRQSNLSVACIKDHHIPIYHRVYNGNENDYVSFKQTINDLTQRIKNTGSKLSGVTLVFDSGPISEENIRLIAEDIKFVSKLRGAGNSDLLSVDLGEFEILGAEEFENIKVYRRIKKLYGQEMVTLTKFDPFLYDAEYKTLVKHLKEVTSRFKQLEKRISEYIKNKRKPNHVTVDTVGNNVKDIFKGRTYLKDFIDIQIVENNGFPYLKWKCERTKLDNYCKKYLGKTIYFTNNMSLTNLEIIRSYSVQYQIERLFKISKDRKGGPWWPKYHWTDQKIKVHAFYCYISMLLLSLLEKELASIGIYKDIHDVIEELNNIHEVVDIYEQKRGKGYKKRRHSELNEIQETIFDHFRLSKYLR